MRKIAEYARTLVPVLNDAGRAYSAKELERLMFEFDAYVQEGVDCAQSNPETFIEFIRTIGKRQ